MKFQFIFIVLVLTACGVDEPQEISTKKEIIIKPDSSMVSTLPAEIDSDTSYVMNDSIKEVETEDDYSEGAKLYLDYLKEEWRNVPSPFIASYNGNYFGDYHHIEFEDENGILYDFGDGNNTYGACELFFDDDHLTDNPQFLNKTMIVYWEWKTSTFPCCEGDYNLTTAKMPSIVNLELKK